MPVGEGCAGIPWGYGMLLVVAGVVVVEGGGGLRGGAFLTRVPSAGATLRPVLGGDPGGLGLTLAVEEKEEEEGP